MTNSQMYLTNNLEESGQVMLVGEKPRQMQTTLSTERELAEAEASARVSLLMRNMSEEDTSGQESQRPAKYGDQKVTKPPKHFKFNPEVRSNIYIADEDIKEIG